MKIEPAESEINLNFICSKVPQHKMSQLETHKLHKISLSTEHSLQIFEPSRRGMMTLLYFLRVTNFLKHKLKFWQNLSVAETNCDNPNTKWRFSVVLSTTKVKK